MSTPFEIKIFSVTGDPEGVRLISKSNWSGIAVVFPRESFSELAKHDYLADYINRAGVYMLVANVAEQAIYIGEADPIKDRMKSHVMRSDWEWAVFFVDALHGLGKTEVQYLEAELVKLAHEANSAIITNKNKPTHPNMSPAGRAAVTVFLKELMSIVPLIGIRAFSVAKSPTIADKEEPPSAFDTIVVPAQEEGFNEVFIGEDCWYAIKIQAKYIPQIKYIAGYVTAPISAITHMAEVESIKPFEDSTKYIVKFKSAAKTIGPIPLADGGITVVPRSPRYTKKEKLLSAAKIADVWK